MSPRLITIFAAGAFLVGGLSACVEETPPTGPETQASRSVAEGSAQVPITLDDKFAEIGSGAPGFGGLYFTDAGELVILTLDPAQGPQALAAARTVLGERLVSRVRPQTGQPPAVRYETARFTFRQLKEWRDAIRAAGWVPGIILMDIDEKGNRLWIGVADNQARATVKDRLESIAVPTAAVVLELMSPPVPDLTLRDRFRPIPGGVQVQDTIRLGGRLLTSTCTNGVNVATSQAFEGFFTSSHCTRRFGDGGDGSLFFQPVVAPDDSVASEFDDAPILHIQGQCAPPNPGCRYSDAAFIRYVSSTLYQHGTIARTTGLGSIEIDPVHPRFLLKELDSDDAIVGDVVNKMGRTTGWSQGQVTNTCVDVSPWAENLTLLCQWLANYDSDPGDSGAPVFMLDGETGRVDLRGIHAGRYPPDVNLRVFSSWVYVVFEYNYRLGDMDVGY